MPGAWHARCGCVAGPAAETAMLDTANRPDTDLTALFGGAQQPREGSRAAGAVAGALASGRLGARLLALAALAAAVERGAGRGTTTPRSAEPQGGARR